MHYFSMFYYRPKQERMTGDKDRPKKFLMRLKWFSCRIRVYLKLKY